MIVIGGFYLIVFLFYAVPNVLGWERAFEWNEIGDSFGILNGLFTALAFAFLIYTSIMQKEELELQREDSRLTREELKKSVEAQQKLHETAEKQLEYDKNKLKSKIQPLITHSRIDLSSQQKEPGWIKYEISFLVNNFRAKIEKFSFLNHTLATITSDDEYMNEKVYVEFEPDTKFAFSIKLRDDDKIKNADFHLKDQAGNLYTLNIKFTPEPYHLPEKMKVSVGRLKEQPD